MRPLPSAAAFQCGVFSLRQAADHGWTSAALRHGTSSGRFIHLRRGAYQIRDLLRVDASLTSFEVARWRHAGPAIGAVLTTVGAVASHSTAAVLRGMPLLFIPDRPCVSVVPWLTGEVPRIHLHRCTAPPPQLLLTPLLPCTTVPRTVIDLAREHGVVSGVVAADFALHMSRTTFAELAAELELCSRWPGVRAAREAIALAEPRSESVLETRSRLKLRDFGIPAPEPQARIGNAWGGFVARVDFYWDEFGVVGEADGDLKYDGTDPEPLLNEKKRQGRLEDLDLRVVRWGSADLRDFGTVAGRLRRTFARAARVPRSERTWRVLPPL